VKKELNLKDWSIEELEELKEEIQRVINEKRGQESKEFEFAFEATNDPRKGKPYVARLYIEDGRIQRKFFDLHREYGKKSITVSGTYTAKAGDIIEKRVGGSWKNDYRYWYLVTDEGEEVKVADISSSVEKARVAEYLKGKISADELIS